MNTKVLSVSFVATMFIALSTFAQAPPYNNLRFEEDWSQLPEDGTGDWTDAIKKIELTDSLWLSLGGEVRMRYESWENFGFNRVNDDEFTLFRTFLHADLHIGEHWRIFVEGRYSTVNNRDLPGGKRAVLDIDEGDFWNTFIEANYDVGSAAMKVRLGRQELQYGKQRLVSPLDWANNRRIFDAGLVRFNGDSGWQLDVFVSSPVEIKPSKWTLNDTMYERVFSGAYYTQKVSDGNRGIDVYFLALNNNKSAPIEEDRYTVGTRYYGDLARNLTFDTELAIQFGQVDYNARQTTPTGRFKQDEDILAWMLTLEGTYTFAETKWKPWITIGLDLASGDDDPADDDNETFNQLFPLAHAYLGFTDVVGRQNIIDLRATLGTWPMPGRLRLRADVHFLSLENENDGLYNAGGGLARSNFFVTPGSRTISADETEVGVALDFTALYKFNKHTDLLFGYSHFNAGDFVEKTGLHEDIDFWYLQWGYTF